MCRRVTLPDGTTVIACSRGDHRPGRRRLCHYCPREAEVLCDAPAAGGGTCDRATCRAHAFATGPDRDLCWEHHREALAAARALGGP